MSKAVKTTRLGKIQTALSEGLIDALKGEPLYDSDGGVIMVEGKPLLGPPKPGILKEAREYLKDMGVTEEPEDVEGHTLIDIASRINQFEQDQDRLLLEVQAKSTT